MIPIKSQHGLVICACTHAQSLSCVLLFANTTDYNPPGSSVHGILQARILEWATMPTPGDLPDPRFKPESPVHPALQADSLALGHWGSPGLVV